MEEVKKSKISKIIDTAITVITVIFAFISISFLTFAISSKKSSDGAVNVFGHEARIVVSNSMEKCEFTDVSNYEIKSLPVKTMVFIDTVPKNEEQAYAWYGDIEIGDVLTFRYRIDNAMKTITHRVINVEESLGKGYTFYLQGDNKNSPDGAMTQVIDTADVYGFNYIIGKVTGQSLFLGSVTYFVSQPLGVGLVVILPAVAIFVYELIKVVNIFSKKKNYENQEILASKDAEINKLREQLEKMQKQDVENNEEK